MLQLPREPCRQAIHQMLHPFRPSHGTYRHEGAALRTRPGSRCHRIERLTPGTSLSVHAMPQTRLLFSTIRQKTDLPSVGNLRKQGVLFIFHSKNSIKIEDLDHKDTTKIRKIQAFSLKKHVVATLVATRNTMIFKECCNMATK